MKSSFLPTDDYSSYERDKTTDFLNPRHSGNENFLNGLGRKEALSLERSSMDKSYAYLKNLGYSGNKNDMSQLTKSF